MRSVPCSIIAAAALSIAALGSAWVSATDPSGLVQPPANQTSAGPTAKPEEGIPIADATVVKACGSCHKPDEKQQLTRISFQRNTPEGWQTTIQRMAALNGLQIDPQTARHVVRILVLTISDWRPKRPHKPAAFEVERRTPDYRSTGQH